MSFSSTKIVCLTLNFKMDLVYYVDVLLTVYEEGRGDLIMNQEMEKRRGISVCVGETIKRPPHFRVVSPIYLCKNKCTPSVTPNPFL